MAEYSFVWHGDKVRDDVLDACAEGLERLTLSAERYIRQGAPVLTGFLRDTVFAFVDATGGIGTRTPALIAGASAEYASYVELGTRSMPARPFITHGVLAVLWMLQPTLAQSVGGKGYSGSGSFGSAGPGVPNPYIGGPLTHLLPDALAEAPLNP